MATIMSSEWVGLKTNHDQIIAFNAKNGTKFEAVKKRERFASAKNILEKKHLDKKTKFAKKSVPAAQADIAVYI